MWAWAALCCVAAAVVAESGTNLRCDLIIDGDPYREETLLSNFKFPSGLAVDYTTDVLYFDYIVDNKFYSAKLDLKTRAVSKIEELTGECVFTIDRVRHGLYAGCVGKKHGRGGGLFKYDSNIGQFVPIKEMGQRIRFAHYNDGLYYSVVGSFLLYRFREGLQGVRVQDVPAEVRSLLVDKRKDWIFYNLTGVYRQRPGSGVATRYTGLDRPYDLAVDAGGTAYACNWEGTRAIYQLHEQAPNTTKLHDITCTGIALDRDNKIIYGDYYDDKLVRLVKC